MSDTVKAVRAISCGLYHRDVKCDECSAWLVGMEWTRWLMDWQLPGSGLHVHHIFGRGGIENEHRSNLVMVSECAHAWGHDRYPNEFRLACLRAKFAKRTFWDGLEGSVLANQLREEIASEFDVPALEKLTGVPLVDWLECQALKVDGVYREYAEEMIRWLRATTGSRCSAT